MLDGGGNGGVSGTTNWFEQNVEQMWPKLANQQTDTHWQHVSGWQKTSELSSMHLSRLKQYREGLIEAWPPEKSEASKAYVARLDFLIDTVQGVYDTAVANHQTLKGVTQAIWESRRNLEQVYNEYQTKKQAKQQYDDQITANNGRVPPGRPPATSDDLETLNYRARAIMYGLSSELATAQIQIRQPPVYKSGRTVDDPPPGGGPMGSSSPPVFPPVVPMSTGGGGGGGAGYTASPTPAIHTVVPTPTAPGAGPILGSTLTSTPPPVTPTPPSIIPPAPPPTVGPGLPPPIAPPGLPPGLKPPGGSYPISPTNGGLPKPGLGTNAGVPPRAMPPGGMIGGSPTGGLGQPGTGAARRINPVGGVIGSGGGAGTTPLGGAGQRPTSAMGRTGVGPGQTLGMGSGTRSSDQSRDAQSIQHWDPDNPWETDEGVAPVMLPSRAPGRIDPGPAIGSNR